MVNYVMTWRGGGDLAELLPEVTEETGKKLTALGKTLEDRMFTVHSSCCWLRLAR